MQPNRQFAADCQFAAQTPMCILNAFSKPKRISAPQMHVSKRCCPAKTAGPAVGEACSARKDHRTGLQGRKWIAAPQTPQSLLSGKHKMCGAGKSECPVLEQIRTPFGSQNFNCSTNANLQPKRQFAADGQFAAQTPICKLSAFFAAQTHFSCPNVCIPEVLLRKDRRACCQGSMRCAPLKSPKGLWQGRN